ncbi:riboflavin kinase [Prauserella endophytica]
MVRGVVVIGAQRGRKLGFPTAKVDPGPVSPVLPPTATARPRPRPAGDAGAS